MAKSFFEGFLKGFGETGSKIVEEKRKVQQEEDLLAKKYDLDFQNQNKLLKAKVDAESKKRQESMKQLKDLYGVQVTTGAVGLEAAPSTTGNVVGGASFEDALTQLQSNPDLTPEQAIAKARLFRERQNPALLNAATNARRADIAAQSYELDALKEGYTFTDTGELTPVPKTRLSEVYSAPIKTGLFVIKPEFVAQSDLSIEELQKYNRNENKAVIDKSVEGVALLESARFRAEELLSAAQDAPTGPIVGSKLGELISEWREDPSQARLSAIVSGILPTIPRTPGPQSNFDVEQLLKSLPGLLKSGASNIEIAAAIYEAVSFDEQRAKFYTELQQKTGGVTSEAANEFTNWRQANPLFTRNNDGELVENKNRISFNDYLNRPPAEQPQTDTTASTKLKSSTSKPPKKDYLKDLGIF